MSRRTRELRLEAEERWPTLRSFIASNLHPDWQREFQNPSEAIADVVAKCSVETRKEVLLEWRNWNSTAGAIQDIRPLLDALGVYIFFDSALDARHFMNSVYDRLIESVRNEFDKRWKP